MAPPINDIPFQANVSRSVHHKVSNLSFGSDGSDYSFSQAHLSTSAPFRARTTLARYPASYPVAGYLEE